MKYKTQYDLYQITDPEMTYKEIGEILGISKQRVKEIEKSALSKLKRTNPELLQEIYDLVDVVHYNAKEGRL